MPACQQCQDDFAIGPDETAFYKKIGVPPPTWCPKCRLQRRMAFPNARNLYKNKCGLCEQEIISMYPEDTPFPVYCIPCWRSDDWDPFEYGRDYDFQRPFFEQFLELRDAAPRMALVQQGEMTGSEYTNRASNNKHCYLIFRANYNENCAYSYTLNNSKDSLDCLSLQHSELCYECVDCVRSYNLSYSRECRDCRDSAFLLNCRNCTDCFGCVNLRNAQYHIWNEPYTKEEYKKKIKEMGLDSREGLASAERSFVEFARDFPREHMVGTQNADVSGNWIYESKNLKNSYMCADVEDGANCFGVLEAKDCRDYFYWGRGAELVYETTNCGYNCQRIRFCNTSHTSCADLEYCDSCLSSRNLFGCVSVKNGEYAILNKKYPPEDFKVMREKIIAHMNEMPYVSKASARTATYVYGEFFPPELSPFGYNETEAQDYFPLTEEKARALGFRWKKRAGREYKSTLTAGNVPDRSASVSEDILKEVIECEHKGECNDGCTSAFRITPQELQFYQQKSIPLPVLCFNCRHMRRLAKRNPPGLCRRNCGCSGGSAATGSYANNTEHFHGNEPCPNEFDTSYAPDRPEAVYCEECYQAEVG